MTFKRMACPLLEIVAGDLSVCYEFGDHAELRMDDVSWLTIYKHDASVSMPFACLGLIVSQDMPAKLGETGVLRLSELGSEPCMDFGDGRLRVEPDVDADGLFRGRLALRNGDVLLRRGVAPARHRLMLTLAEQRALAGIADVLVVYDEVISLGMARIDVDPPRGQRLTLEQAFVFAGDMHVCEFTPGGEFVLQPFDAAASVCDRCEAKAERKALQAKRALRLSRTDALRLLEFGAAELRSHEAVTDAAVRLPRDGRVLRVNDERSVGVFRSVRYFPGDDEDACPLVPFLLSEWRWLVACLRLYLATGDCLAAATR